MNILDLFYHHIIPEAQTGRINCFFYYNMPFSTVLVETSQRYDCELKIDGLLIPTLVIRNKQEFDRLLVEYVKTASEFYDDQNFEEEVLNGSVYDEESKICREKIILTLLFANMTVEDFENPHLYLKRRIAFLNQHLEKKYELGSSTFLKSDLEIEVKKDRIYNEAPYQFIVKTKGGEYIFPKVKFGIDDHKAYIYAIQGEKQRETALSKKVNRLLYKIGEGFNSLEDNFTLYEEGNLKDVTASFLVALNMAFAYFKELGIDEVIAPSILIERWNAKRMALEVKEKYQNWSAEKKAEEYEKQNQLQSNLTEKFIRTFLRLQHHYSNLEIYSFPQDLDSQLHLRWNGKEEVCNNTLLSETNRLVQMGIQNAQHFRL